MPRVLKCNSLTVEESTFKVRDFAPLRPMAAPAPAREETGEEDAGFQEIYAADGGPVPQAQPVNYNEIAQDIYDQPMPQNPSEPMQTEIIQGAMTEASRILEEAVRTAESSRQEILAKGHAEADDLRRQAAQQGRKEGFSSVVGEMREIATGLEDAIARFEGERAGYEAEYEEHLKWFAVEIASKVLAKKVTADDGEMTEMVAKVIQGVQKEPWIRVEVAQEMSHLLARLTELYGGQEHIDVVSVAGSPPGTVHVETPSGIIDASLRTQLENLKGYFDQAPR